MWSRTPAIIGGLALNDGSDELTNHGTVAGNVVMGNGSDRLVNTGTITGAVNLADTLTAGAISDTFINGGLVIGDVQLGKGNDIFRSQGGRIEGAVFGGSGDDQYFVDDSALRIVDIAGTDSVVASVDYALAGGLESLVLIGAVGLIGSGNADANQLVGGNGDDTLRGGGGDDTISGGEGDDQLHGGSGDDIFIYQDGDATISGGQGLDSLSFVLVDTDAVVLNLATGSGSAGTRGSLTVAGIESVEGGAAADFIIGSSGADTIAGGPDGADTLSGGGGDDRILGLSHADVLTGGAGEDVFAFRAMTDSTADAADRITDFSRPRDKIDLSAIDAAFGDAASSFVFIGTGAFTDGASGEVRFRIDAVAGTTIV